MTFHIDKDLKNGCQYKKKMARKRPSFWYTLIQAVEEEMHEYFLQNIHLYEKYILIEKISLLTS